MSRFTHAAATMHTLSLAAMEEASRFGVRDADIDHLLLALTIDPDTGGQILRGMGAGLDTARAAVAAQHAAQLELVGIASDPDGLGRIVFHETSGYEWTERALTVLKEASSGDRRGDSAAVLRTLIDEPSGLIEEILRRIDVDPGVLSARLDDVQRLRLAPQQARDTHTLSGTRSLFAPASRDDVWALLSSASRIPEWDPAVGTIDADDTTGPWEAESRTQAPDGRPVRVKDEFRRQRVELMECERPSLIRWRFSYPDAVRSNPRLVDFELEHAAGGTQIRATLTWETTRGRGGRRLVRALLKPLHRLLVFTQLAQIESGITRVFR
ncbi:SRPBCC family protein [Microbacterium maritypicum]|uniref:SRPBCC family protein n=2 Tax=Microbacterium maritypicum TaxID=33918 RepID=A0ACD4B6I7_MICMQ|nr:Clp protease N-terminal domain-containing protein [Microbacterium liquefaciens]UTT53039.1 SRPBCC family protein [Microbacterium liquefaciens]